MHFLSLEAICFHSVHKVKQAQGYKQLSLCWGCNSAALIKATLTDKCHCHWHNTTAQAASPGQSHSTGACVADFRSSLNTDTAFLLWGWLNPKVGLPREVVGPPASNIQNLTGHSPEEPALIDPALSRALDQITSRNAFQPQPFMIPFRFPSEPLQIPGKGVQLCTEHTTTLLSSLSTVFSTTAELHSAPIPRGLSAI